MDPFAVHEYFLELSFLYHKLNLLFYFEILCMLFILFSILLFRLILVHRSKKRKKIQKELAYRIYLDKPLMCHSFKKNRELLHLLEKERIEISYEEKEKLRKKARRWAGKRGRKKQVLSAKIFALSPNIGDLPYLASLMKNPHFSIRYFVMNALTKMDDPRALDVFLEEMKRSKGYEELIYRDLLEKHEAQKK